MSPHLMARSPTCSPHGLRRTMVGDALDAGLDLALVRRMAGHAQVATTAREDRRGEAAKERGFEALHEPHQRGRWAAPIVDGAGAS